MLFVYRSHYEGPLGKRVVTLPDDSVLAWFRRGWTAGEDWPSTELGGDVYGLGSVFRAVLSHDLPVPGSVGELRAVLHEHLYVEGDEDDIRLDDHSLRVRTDDDEVELAYYFLDDHVIAEEPSRLAYLLHESWPLPHTAGGATSFTPDVPVLPATGSGGGTSTTYALFLTFYDGDSLGTTPPLSFPGVDLPNLAAHLTSTTLDEDWPVELKVLWALTTDDLATALARCDHWPDYNDPTFARDHPTAHAAALPNLATTFAHGRDPSASLLRVDDHLAQFAMHVDTYFGHRQWFLFDTTWAATHPDLAHSLLRYGGHWDPLGE
ncbi:hypothetical protein [Actinosynnema sp. NPDC020468]|uniref:hypothetical protein n=1 Tax=Actinosynnema sp. NPDC020468 TaxID=3154488 RepID=UPI0033DD6E1C